MILETYVAYNEINEYNVIKKIFLACQYCHQKFTELKSEQKKELSNQISEKIQQRSTKQVKLGEEIAIIEKYLSGKDLSNREKEKLQSQVAKCASKGSRKDKVMLIKNNLNDKLLVIIRKEKQRQKRKEYHKANVKFELFRTRFYKDIMNENKTSIVSNNDMKTFWNKMWNNIEEPDMVKATRSQAFKSMLPTNFKGLKDNSEVIDSKFCGHLKILLTGKRQDQIKFLTSFLRE